MHPRQHITWNAKPSIGREKPLLRTIQLISQRNQCSTTGYSHLPFSRNSGGSEGFRSPLQLLWRQTHPPLQVKNSILSGLHFSQIRLYLLLFHAQFFPSWLVMFTVPRFVGDPVCEWFGTCGSAYFRYPEWLGAKVERKKRAQLDAASARLLSCASVR